MTLDNDRCADFFSELHSDHALLLRESAIEPCVAAARRYESVNTKARLKALGFSESQQQCVALAAPALLIPIWDMEGNICSYELRPNKPRIRDGKRIKYEKPKGSRACLDIPNIEAVRTSLRCDGPPLFITEGSRKVDAAISQKLLCIGIGGVDTWRGKQEIIEGITGLTALAEWEYIHLKGRRVYLCFDSDYRRKKQVRRALRRFKKFLDSRGADVWICWLPDAPDGSKQGLDDFFFAGGTLQELLNTATYDIPAEAEFEDEGAQSYNTTDLGNAQRFIEHHSRNVRYCHKWAKWLVWDGKRWRVDESAAVYSLAKQTVQSIYGEAQRITDEERRKAVAKWAVYSEQLSRIEAMIRLAAVDASIAVDPNELDSDPFLLNVPNGTVDLRTGILRPHSRRDLITKLAPVNYKADAVMPSIEQWLQEIMRESDDLIHFIKRALGYSLTADTREQVLFICYGTGANGKSTLLSLFQEMMGDYATSTNASTLMARRADAIPNDIAALKGARFVSAMEVEEGQRFSEALVKRLTGNDRISARFMRGEWFEFDATFKIWLAVNHKPTVRGTDKGIWRRIRLIPFTVSIPEEKQDKTLFARLRAELPGFLKWTVEGCLEWQKFGLGIPDEVRQATDTYQSENDIVGQFIGEKCLVQESVSARSGQLYDVFKSWCQSNGEHERSNKWFSDRLAEKGFQKKRRNDGAQWTGLGLVADGTEYPVPEDV